MGKVRICPPVKLICGLIFREDEVLNKAMTHLVRRFGKIDYESETLAFIYTDYYAKEFGTDLRRKFISFARLIDPAGLYRVKLFSNNIEERLSRASFRLINIDPGYLDLSKLVLASTKDYSHRIYLNKGIFAEITLSFQDKSFRPLEWTYPDYRTAEYISIFNHLRDVYSGQIKHK